MRFGIFLFALVLCLNTSWGASHPLDSGRWVAIRQSTGHIYGAANLKILKSGRIIGKYVDKEGRRTKWVGRVNALGQVNIYDITLKKRVVRLDALRRDYLTDWGFRAIKVSKENPSLGVFLHEEEIVFNPPATTYVAHIYMIIGGGDLCAGLSGWGVSQGRLVQGKYKGLGPNDLPIEGRVKGGRFEGRYTAEVGFEGETVLVLFTAFLW